MDPYSELAQFAKDVGVELGFFDRKKPVIEQKKKYMNKKRCKGCTYLGIHMCKYSGINKFITHILSPCPNKRRETP